MFTLSHQHAAELESILRRNVDVISSNCLQQNHPLLISGIGELAVNLRECIETFNRGHRFRCRANHDLGLSEAEDVAHLITKLRHSFVHSSTTKHKDMDDRENRLSWGFCFGQGIHVHTNGVDIGCDYPDDVGVCFGKNVVLIKRHLLFCHNFYVRAFSYTHGRSHTPNIRIFTDPAVDELDFWVSELNDINTLTPQQSPLRTV